MLGLSGSKLYRYVFVMTILRDPEDTFSHGTGQFFDTKDTGPG